LFSSVAQAQEGSSNAEGDGHAEIVVTARGRVQALEKVPISVSVVSGTDLQRANITSLENLSSLVSNVNISSGPTVDQMNIRGVGSGQNAGFEQAVGTFSDGIYRARSRSVRAALFDVDRVEILKGPQTTFFGANAIAGALSITTRKPGHELEYNMSGLYGSDEEYEVEAGVTLPIDGDLSVRIAGRASGMMGFIDHGKYGVGPDQHEEQGRIALRWDPSTNYRMDLRIDYGQAKARHSVPWEVVGCPAPAPYPFDPTNVCGRFIAFQGAAVDDKLDWHSDSPPSPSRYRFTESALTQRLMLGDHQLTATTGYFNHRYRANSHIIPVYITGTVQGYSPLPAEVRESYSQVSQELRLESPDDGAVSYMAGLYASYSKLEVSSTTGFFFLPFGAFAPPSLGTTADTPVTGIPRLNEDNTTLSAFAAATVRPVDHVRLNLGGRFSSIHKAATRPLSFGTSVNAYYDTFVAFSSPAAVPTFCAIIGCVPGPFANPTRTDSKFMPSAGVEFDIGPSAMVYATYANGFKAGGYSAAATPDEFGPEAVDAYEIGVKGSLFDRRLAFGLALFRSDYDGLQETAYVNSGGGALTPVVRNAAKSRSQGVEFAGSLRLSTTFTLTADIAYLDAIYQDFPNAPCTSLANLTPGCIQNVSGKRRAYAPEFSGSVGARMTAPIGDALKLEISPTLRFSSSYYQSASVDPLLRQEAYAKADLSLQFGPTDERWAVSVIGRNLNDRITSGYRQDVPLAPGTIAAIPDRGRSVSVRLSLRH